tara:strand:- start:346 stop:1236 length:891 start_codon:yes stop_codon:yes gene_type:complete
MEEITNEEVTPQTEETTAETPAIDPDPKVMVGGEEYSAAELAEAKSNYDQLQDYAVGLENFREATYRLMDPNISPEAKKEDARQILLSANYEPQQVEEWIKVYDQEGQSMPEGQPPAPQSDPRIAETAYQTQKMNEDLLKMRARMLQENMEKQISSAITDGDNPKILIDWIKNNRQSEDVNSATENLTERVRQQAMENLRNRRNAAGTFDDSWLGEEVSKAADKVAQDMLTVIGDPSKIGKIPETGQQTENLYRTAPVKLPDNKDKKFGDIEGDLHKWVTSELMDGISNQGENSKL